MAMRPEKFLTPRVIDISGVSRTTDVSISTSAAATAALGSTRPQGSVYDLLSDVDCYIAIGTDPATGLTTSTGYFVLAGNVVPVFVPSGEKIGVIAASSGTLKIHRTTQ